MFQCVGFTFKQLKWPTESLQVTVTIIGAIPQATLDFLLVLVFYRNYVFLVPFPSISSRPSDHYFRSVCLFVCLSVCLFVCAEFFSAVFDPIWI